VLRTTKNFDVDLPVQFLCDKNDPKKENPTTTKWQKPVLLPTPSSTDARVVVR